MGEPKFPQSPRWGVDMAHPDAIQILLKEKGFHFEKLDDSDDEMEALYIKGRPGGTSIYITIPVNCEDISEDVLLKIMETAHIPRSEYNYLLLSS